MRRILKNKGSVNNYIRQAVESGVYRSHEELEKVWKERANSEDELYVIMRRFRQDIVRGSNIADYPAEYLILQQHPPIPDPPKTPKKLMRRMKEEPNPTERLVAKYLKRQEHQEQTRSRSRKSHRQQSYTGGTDTSPKTTQEYYQRLLGVPEPPSLQSTLGQKSAKVQRAYAAAIKHYELQRTTTNEDGQPLTDAQAMRRVDELLSQQRVEERAVAAERAIRAKQQQEQEMDATRSNPTTVLQDILLGGTSPTLESATTSSENGVHPRTIEAMIRWSERLQSVPYVQWTVGASTALDHWIARQVLGVSEETWQSLLEGDVGNDPHLLSMGREIIVLRETLFPETKLDDDLHAQQQRQFRHVGFESEDHSDETAQDEKILDQTVEDLLSSMKDDYFHIKDSNWDLKTSAATNVDDQEYMVHELDVKVDQLVDELQDWRRQNMELPFDDWSKEDQDRFNIWMKDYVSAVSSHLERIGGSNTIDYDSTRKALLSQPPISRDESESFWNRLQEEGQAAALLDMMRRDGPPAGASILHEAFWGLPYEEQLDCLLNLGALRPLMDEYASDIDRTRFLQRHGDTILTGVQMEHLVPDPNGPVKASDLGMDIVEELGVGRNDRFRLEIRPFRSTDDMSADEKSRALFAAWNQHKTGRARYEEKMFRTGRLGLRYGDTIKDDDAIDDDEGR